MIVSVLVLCQTGPSEVIGWGSQQLTVYEIEDIDFGLLASVPRRRVKWSAVLAVAASGY